jgi:murein DD-endopeptidase MepM/ murein hydrolase activator NlpD
MTGPRSDADPPRPSSLNDRGAHEWRQLSAEVVRARTGASFSRVNVTIEAAAEREPQSPASPAYRLWIADNLARDARYADAVLAYDKAIDRAQSCDRLFATSDPIRGALYHKAQAAALAGDASTAIATFRELGEHAPDDAAPLFQAGLLAESEGQLDRAAEFYRTVAARTPSARTDDPAELARRALQRLERSGTAYAADPRQLADLLVTALEQRDVRALERVASRTHFAIGPVGGHTEFEDVDLLDELYRDLQASRVTARRGLLGTGGKLYLPTSGWRGQWFRGDVMFIITKAPRGWEWTGLGLAFANDLWLERWRPQVKQTNQPLPFEILAPWPAGQSFMAGGLTQYIGQQAAILAAGLIGGAVLALVFARNRCGFGPRGFYYNQFSTHEGTNAFAIDFTRYRRYVPYDNESAGTPVLAVREGIVTEVWPGIPSGDPSNENRVEIAHDDPTNPGSQNRFTSRYLHLEGPFKIPVSEDMHVLLGTRLGQMDDTGNSVINHLHFSIHRPNGMSVRPTPMNGVRLEDGDSGTCVRSTNIENAGEKPMKELTAFAGQNWLITPAATAANETPPGRIQDQKWLLVLSGVAIADIRGDSAAHWLHETASIRPELDGPLHHAINRYGIPTPPGSDGLNYRSGFQVDQWAPFAGLSSIFNQGNSVNSGFAVDVWRPNPFGSGTDAFSNAMLNNLFSGIQVDVAVRDSDAWLFRVGYNITLLGKIVFTRIIIT